MPIPIYVIGSSNTDMVIQTEKLPRAGETVIGGSFFMNPGGKGANQAVAAARLGGKVSFVANIGKDLFGQQALEQFQNEKIDVHFISIDDKHPSGIALIGVENSGENLIMVAPGSNAQLTVSQVDKALDSINGDAIVLLQLEVPMHTVYSAIEKAYQKGLRIILNPAPAQPIEPKYLSYLTVITPNEHEAELLTGIRVDNLERCEEAAIKLYSLGIQHVIITLGEKGAYLYSNGSGKLIAASKVNAVDTTAAGDCFNGALAVGLAENKTLEEAVHFAGSASAIAVTRMGAQSSMPYRWEVIPVGGLFHS